MIVSYFYQNYINFFDTSTGILIRKISNNTRISNIKSNQNSWLIAIANEDGL